MLVKPRGAQPEDHPECPSRAAAPAHPAGVRVRIRILTLDVWEACAWLPALVSPGRHKNKTEVFSVLVLAHLTTIARVNGI